MNTLNIFLFSTLISASIHVQALDSQKFFSELATAMNDPAQKKQAIAVINTFGPEHKRNFEIGLRSEFKKMEPMLPMRIDAYTQLESAHVFSDAIRYNFRLSQSYMREFNVADFKNNIGSIVINEACSNPRMFFAVILDFRIIHFYYAPDGSIVQEVTVSERDCA